LGLALGCVDEPPDEDGGGGGEEDGGAGAPGDGEGL